MLRCAWHQRRMRRTSLVSSRTTWFRIMETTKTKWEYSVPHFWICCLATRNPHYGFSLYRIGNWRYKIDCGGSFPFQLPALFSPFHSSSCQPSLLYFWWTWTVDYQLGKRRFFGSRRGTRFDHFQVSINAPPLQIEPSGLNFCAIDSMLVLVFLFQSVSSNIFCDIL